jgi:hypothetical protein
MAFGFYVGLFLKLISGIKDKKNMQIGGGWIL